jgi:hypothetical protein
MKIIVIMAIGRGYVSELQPPTGLLFISEVIYEHGEPWRNDIDRENSCYVHQSSLAILTAESSGSKQEEQGKKS